MARRPKPTMPSLLQAVLGKDLKAFLDWVDATLFDKPDKRLTVFTIDRATYTLTKYDVGRYLRFTTACTVTVAPSGSVPDSVGGAAMGSLTEGDVFHIRATNGVVTIVEGSGVTVNVPTGCNANTRDAVASIMLVYVDDDEYDLLGDLELP